MSTTNFKTPTYSLVEVQAQVKAQGRKAFTKSAIDCGQDGLGMTTKEMIEFIGNYPNTGFYKTMPSKEVPGAMQDVYRWQAPEGQAVYVKVSLDPRSRVVISFKEK